MKMKTTCRLCGLEFGNDVRTNCIMKKKVFTMTDQAYTDYTLEPLECCKCKSLEVVFSGYTMSFSCQMCGLEATINYKNKRGYSKCQWQECKKPYNKRT